MLNQICVEVNNVNVGDSKVNIKQLFVSIAAQVNMSLHLERVFSLHVVECGQFS